MKFSVVIPLYNKKEYILNTVQSALGQTFRDFEILVVDDGSTDGSAEALAGVSCAQLRLIRQTNAGVSAARNTGIRHARGTYIAFLDADDLWHPDYLEEIDRLTARYPASDLFVTAYRVLLPGGKEAYSSRKTPPIGCLESYWETLADPYDFVWTSAATVRRQALLDAGLFCETEEVGEDLDLWARVARRNPRVAYSSALCVDYNRRTVQNARTRVRIAEAKAFRRDLERELDMPGHSAAAKRAIGRKLDLKTTAYVYTALLAGEKALACSALRAWKRPRTVLHFVLRFGLACAARMPDGLLRAVYRFRLNHF